MKFLLLPMLVLLTSCVGSLYEIETPEGYKARVRTTSDTDEVVFHMVKSGDQFTVDLYKLGSSNAAVLQSLTNATDVVGGVAQSAIPLMLRGLAP